MHLKLYVSVCARIGHNEFLCFGSGGWSGKRKRLLDVCARLLDLVAEVRDGVLKL